MKQRLQFYTLLGLCCIDVVQVQVEWEKMNLEKEFPLYLSIHSEKEMRQRFITELTSSFRSLQRKLIDYEKPHNICHGTNSWFKRKYWINCFCSTSRWRDAAWAEQRGIQMGFPPACTAEQMSPPAASVILRKNSIYLSLECTNVLHQQYQNKHYFFHSKFILGTEVYNLCYVSLTLLLIEIIRDALN